MRRQIHSDFKGDQSFFDDIISNFDTKGENFGNQDRNSLKLFDLKGLTVNVKSFKVPNAINQIAYKFFRKSKAERSYKYANSPGNTLIQLQNGDYKFYLVDLNRMRFETMNFEARIKNMSRLTIDDALVRIMSDEYAKLSGTNFDKVYNALCDSIDAFQRKLVRRKELKKKLLFRS